MKNNYKKILKEIKSDKDYFEIDGARLSKRDYVICLNYNGRWNHNEIMIYFIPRLHEEAKIANHINKKIACGYKYVTKINTILFGEEEISINNLDLVKINDKKDFFVPRDRILMKNNNIEALGNYNPHIANLNDGEIRLENEGIVYYRYNNPLNRDVLIKYDTIIKMFGGGLLNKILDNKSLSNRIFLKAIQEVLERENLNGQI